MGKSIRGTTKSRGRPRTTGAGVQIGMRWQEEELRAIDGWRRQEPDSPARPQAIRRLVGLGLAGSSPAKHTNPTAAAKASDMAGRRIDEIGDPSATAEERQDRKRRLIKGPREFREMRSIEPKPKD